MTIIQQYILACGDDLALSSAAAFLLLMDASERNVRELSAPGADDRHDAYGYRGQLPSVPAELDDGTCAVELISHGAAACERNL